VALSGKAVDACGVCGGDGSSCCIPKPAQAEWHFVRIDHHYNVADYGIDNSVSSTAPSDSTAWSSTVTRARVGDLVVWENLLNWEVKIVSGAYDYKGAPAVDLSRLATPQSDHLPDNDAIDAFLKVGALPLAFVKPTNAMDPLLTLYCRVRCAVCGVRCACACACAGLCVDNVDQGSRGASDASRWQAGR
jgi:hypothetical protein